MKFEVNTKKITFLIIATISIYLFCDLSVDKVVLAENATTTPSTEDAINPADDIRSKINKRNQDIAELEQDIKIYKEEIDKASKTATTLKGQLNTLSLTKKKLAADIKLTQKKIESVEYTIKDLSLQINDKQSSIKLEQDGLRQVIVNVNELDNRSQVELFLSKDNLSDFWNDKSRLSQVSNTLEDNVKQLIGLKNDLSDTKATNEKKHNELLALFNKLADQKAIAEYNAKQTDSLLTQTKNKETNYKKMLADRESKRLAFEQELLDYESQLKLLIDPSYIPQASKVLFPPLDSLVITQKFGDTDFSRAHASVYNGHGHNGVDFKASIGTPVKASLSGTISGVGDTDGVCSGASYGKWVLITHPNGLSTLYGHLSLIKVTEGSTVHTGDIIGYSGNTGYSTGPHLHFTVFATAGMKVTSRKSSVCKGTYRMPVADLRAYLNPTLYL